MANKRPNITDDYDRDRGVFTPRDRRFLAGLLDDELSDNEKRQKRYRLRRRMVHALQDLAYLRVMSTEDIAQIAGDFGYPQRESELDEAIAPHSSEARRRGLVFDAIEEMIAFGRELSSVESLDQMFRRHIAIRAAVDHYEETGEFAVYEPTAGLGDLIEQVDTLTIDELEEAVYGEEFSRRDFVETPGPGAFEVLDLAGIAPPRREPDCPREHIYTLIDIVKDLSDESGEADIREVVETLAERLDISTEQATEVYRNASFLSVCYMPRFEKVALYEEFYE